MAVGLPTSLKLALPGVVHKSDGLFKPQYAALPSTEASYCNSRCRRPGKYEARRVQQVRLHPGWTLRDPRLNNLALLQLSQPCILPPATLAAGEIGGPGEGSRCQHETVWRASEAAAAAPAASVQCSPARALHLSHPAVLPRCSRVCIPHKSDQRHGAWIWQPQQ